MSEKIKKKRKSRVPYEDYHKEIDGIEHKKCKICEQWLPMNDEHFYKRKNNYTDGFYTYCKKCTVAKTSKYQKDNWDKVRITQLNWYYNNHEHATNRFKGYYKENKERISNYFSDYQKREYVKNNLQVYRQKRQNKNHLLTLDEWDGCRLYFNYRCAYCGKSYEDHYKENNTDFHKEHVIECGRPDIKNCVPSCKSCNSEKHIYTLNQWYNKDNSKYSIGRYKKIVSWMKGDYRNYIKKKNKSKLRKMKEFLNNL
ncbi:HNH endonuclease [Priestia aryabhattai]|uniref:HNH endonuclease n=1 Tax=Priestia aryabhattai TaxID=412384 RepID=UPI0015F4AA50|nr:HNH endonuclease signature motif containing protein [Priestia aryabhattai]